jgi:hypothetical protein
MSALLNTPPITDWRLVIRIGLPAFGTYIHMLSPTRSVLRPLSLAGDKKSAATFSRPSATWYRRYSRVRPLGSTLIKRL